MKGLLLLILWTSTAFSSAIMNCGLNQVRVWSPNLGYSCQQQYQPQSTGGCFPCSDPLMCLNPYQNWFQSFPPAIYQPNPVPWWAYQGNMYYPNLYYPGAWNPNTYNPSINAQYYPGQGEIFAAKPNVYVESIHSDKKFSFAFSPDENLSFLSTTPAFHEKREWKGKLVQHDRFEVKDIQYDYLFYDIRLPKSKMQFERGLCALREEAIKWMLGDLKALKYPAIALQDFEEHWRVKIPDYPFYCIYPQYNQQLDAALPVTISLDQVSYVRALYVLVPHKKEPDVDEPQSIPFPYLDSTEIRPKGVIKHETMFKEWGVAFLGE